MIHSDTYDFKDYEDKIKDYCSVCMKAIDATWASYQLRGNYCSTCNEKCTRAVRTKDARDFREKIIDELTK